MRIAASLATLLLLLSACGDDDPVVVGTDTDAADTGGTSDVDTGSTADTGSGDTTADTSDDTGTDSAPDAVEDTDVDDLPTLAGLHADVLSGCGGVLCHLSGQSQGGLNLDLDTTLFDRLLAPSSVPGLATVEPGSPDDSYLYLKITGQHLEAGGTGSRMPLGAGALPSSKIDAVAAWIESL